MAQSGGQGGGGGSQDPFLHWDIQQGQSVIASGERNVQAGGLQGAIDAAKAKAVSLGLTNYGIVIRHEGQTVYTENIQTGGGQTQQGQGGGAAGGGWTGGYGQEGSLQFRYRLVGFSQTNREEYVIRSSLFNYGSAPDAIAGGREKGDNNLEVVRVFADASIPGFAGQQYTYSDRYTTQSNQAAADADAAYRAAQDNPGTLDLGGDGKGADNALAGLAGDNYGKGADNALMGLAGDNWLIIAVIAVVLIAIIAIYMGKGG